MKLTCLVLHRASYFCNKSAQKVLITKLGICVSLIRIPWAVSIHFSCASKLISFTNTKRVRVDIFGHRQLHSISPFQLDQLIFYEASKRVYFGALIFHIEFQLNGCPFLFATLSHCGHTQTLCVQVCELVFFGILLFGPFILVAKCRFLCGFFSPFLSLYACCMKSSSWKCV